MRIIIVDDNEDARKILQKTLEGAGHEVETASDGLEALKAARAAPPDTIVSDILMPVMDGFHLLKEVRADQTLKDTHFIFYTATYRDPKDEELAVKLGADAFFIKPMDPVLFIDKIKDTLGKRVNNGRPQPEPEEAILKLYNERLVKKLEKKMLDLEKEVAVRKRTEDALKESEKRLALKNGIAHTLMIASEEEMYEKALKTILDALDSPFGIFGYIDEKGDWFCPSLTREIWEQCRVPDKDIRFPHDTWGGLWGKALTERRTLLSNKPMTVPEGHLPITRALCVPILHGQVLVGLLVVANKDKDYDERDRGRLEALADYIAPVLHARLERDAGQQEKEKLEEQLRQAQKMEAIGTLAGGVAHDFNNLLSVIIGNADLLLMDMDERHPLQDRIEGIKNAGHRASTLTSQLLAFSRKQVIHPETLNINGLVKGTEKMLRRIIGEDIQLHTALSQDLHSARLDPGQLDQILMNLAVNARDAMPKGGSLTLETANVELDSAYFSNRVTEGAPGSYVMLAISDTGTGMDKDTRARIFEPFFTTKGLGRGTGLGLSTVYGIVKQNNGHIWVYSEPGQGTTFKVYFPMVSGEAAPDKKEEKELRMEGSETLLVVEDDKMVMGLIQKSLERYGYKMLQASNGEEALELAGAYEDDIHILLTDVVMPGMPGREVADAMHGARPGIKIIYMSGYTDDTITRHGILPNGTNFLQKPISPAGMVRKVREVLDE